MEEIFVALIMSCWNDKYIATVGHLVHITTIKVVYQINILLPVWTDPESGISHLSWTI